MNGLSVFSEHNAIAEWLKTPVGYFKHKPEFGNKIDKALFKNPSRANIILDLIVDDIKNDLGEEVARTIVSIQLFKIKDEIDSFVIVIKTTNGDIVFGE